MTLTPSTKGAFFAGIGLWLMLWLALFKVDEVFGETLLGRFITTEPLHEVDSPASQHYAAGD